MSTEWYLQNTRYFSGNEKEEIEEVYNVFDEILSQSPETYQVDVSGINKNIIIQSTANYNERRILFKENDIQWGDIVDHEGEKWLVTERPFFNKIHSKSHIQLCNNVMKFETETGGEYEYDRLGNKVWVANPKTIRKEFPCVIDSISNTKTTTGQQINIPEGDMTIQISYTTDKLISIGNEFTMFGDNYRISGIDKSKAHSNQGVLILIVTRKQNNT